MLSVGDRSEVGGILFAALMPIEVGTKGGDVLFGLVVRSTLAFQPTILRQESATFQPPIQPILSGIAVTKKHGQWH